MEATNRTRNRMTRPDPIKSDVKEEKYIVANCVKLNIRDRPSLEGKIVGAVDADDVLTVLNRPVEPVDFWQVRTENGDEGFCMKKFLHPDDF